MVNSSLNMSISGLSEASGVPISAIKFYNRKGLLPKAIKTGKTKAFYTLHHLNRLKLIKKLQHEEKMSLKKISDIITLIGDEDDNGNGLGAEILNHKPKIIEAAISVIRSKGYENTTIEDIVKAAQVGKGTFYKYFKNKKELFISCIKEIIIKEAVYVDVYESIADIKDEKDVFNALNEHLENLYWINPLLREMINMLRAAAINNPEEFSDTLEDVMQLKIDKFKELLKSGIEQGVLREFNETDLTILAVMALGIQEYCYDYFKKNRMDLKQGQNILWVITNVFLNGIKKR